MTAALPNPLLGWRLRLEDLHFIGTNLQRPECILAERDGTLWSADARGGVMKIAPDGRQTLITQSIDSHFDLEGDVKASLLTGTLPNGLAFAANGDVLISNFGTDRLEVMTRSGETRILYDSIEGLPIGKVNFVLRDSKNRIWLTVSTMVNPWSNAITPAIRDGYIALADHRGIRVIADGFQFTNEIRFDAAEEWLYVAETTGKHITRLRIGEDCKVLAREIYGPENLGDGLVDGIAFDAYGNLWTTMIFADRLIAITPTGDVEELAVFGNPEATAAFERAFAGDGPVPFAVLNACGGSIAPWLASITFSGSDLRTVCLGSLRGTTLPFFRSPVAGLPMIHW